MQNQPLQIPITITTGYFESGDKAQDDRIRIDQTSYYLASIFWFMNTACKGYELLDMQTETKLFTFVEFRSHIENLSEIGNALAERLTIYSLAIKDSETLSHAEMISHLINDESVPDEISDSLAESLNAIFNNLPVEVTARKEEFSPEYIEQVLSDYSEVKDNV